MTYRLLQIEPSVRNLVLGVTARRLGASPVRPTWTLKHLVNLVRPVAPNLRGAWELRVAGHRVYYEVDPGTRTVFVRAVRTQPAAEGEREVDVRRFTVRDLQKTPGACLDAAQTDTVVVTRHGKPVALVLGVRGQDAEAVATQLDAGSWRLVEARRLAPTIPLEEMTGRVRVDGGRPGATPSSGERHR